MATHGVEGPLFSLPSFIPVAVLGQGQDIRGLCAHQTLTAMVVPQGRQSALPSQQQKGGVHMHMHAVRVGNAKSIQAPMW